MAVTHLEVCSRKPYENGVSFGEAGQYEQIDGVMHFAVDAANPANVGIVDLDKAERGSDGQVHFLADFSLLQPADPSRANRRLLFEVLNRGRKAVMSHLQGATHSRVPSERIEPGDGYLMRHGWTLAWCGWQWDVVRGPAFMGLEAPQAGAGGQPIPGQVLVSFQPNLPQQDQVLADTSTAGATCPYPAADIEQADAELLVCDWPDAPRRVVPRQDWRFARDEGGTPVADDAHVWLKGGFQPGRIYELVYQTRICPIVGTGLLAVRDAATFLRHATEQEGNPCAGRIDSSYGYGESQSGRFLRHFLHLGLNVNEQGRQVFDGVLSDIAGARRGEFNHRYAQPSHLSTLSFGHLPPFTLQDETDPSTGTADGLLHRQSDRGGVPKVVLTNSSTEYYRAFCSLIHTDALGQHDVEPPPEARIYYFAGTQHVPGGLPLRSANPEDGRRGMYPFNVVSQVPLMRAALVNLDRWVSEGEEPPPSVFPRLSDGTALPAADVFDAFRDIPDAAVPKAERLRALRRLDLGPEADQGIGCYPAQVGTQYPTYVSAVDGDRNEVGGIRLPDLTVPVATYTAWNPRHPSIGGKGQILEALGSTLPFAATEADRARTGDPRRSIANRYPDRDTYLAKVRQAATELVAQRYVLDEDAELLVRIAGERYDAFTQIGVSLPG